MGIFEEGKKVSFYKILVFGLSEDISHDGYRRNLEFFDPHSTLLWDDNFLIAETFVELVL